jgi:hypothetical protein
VVAIYKANPVKIGKEDPSKLLREEISGTVQELVWDSQSLTIYLIVLQNNTYKILVIDVSTNNLIKNNALFQEEPVVYLFLLLEDLLFVVYQIGFNFGISKLVNLLSIILSIIMNFNGILLELLSFFLSKERSQTKIHIFSFDGIQFATGQLSLEHCLAWRPRGHYVLSEEDTKFAEADL